MNNPIPIEAYEKIYYYNKRLHIKRWLLLMMAFFILLSILPWTQNIKSKGKVTTLYQEQRPQQLHSNIPGRIKKWYVKEGDFVKQGDTIMLISEIKEDYLDPMLVYRTKQQANAKQNAIENYRQKITSIEAQIQALENAKEYKIQQLKNKYLQIQNKLTADNAELTALENEMQLTKNQFERNQSMYNEGLISQTQLQQRNIAYQNTLAKKIATENKILQTKQELLNINLEQSTVLQDYNEKQSKSLGDKFQSEGQINSNQADVSKLENQATNYSIRNGMYFILASQDGQITQAKKAGIGEIIKEGETIATVVPTTVNYAVEIFVSPVDLPLIHQKQKVKFVFDGYPAIIFSGWPQNSYGTFSGEITSFENSISSNGMFRVLIQPDKNDRPWPQTLKVGTGVQSITLLQDVPLLYEIWRKINGFPPNFYEIKEGEKDEKK